MSDTTEVGEDTPSFRAILFDTETTALQDGEIMELAWVPLGEDFKRQGNIRVQRFGTARPCTYGALATHHILPSEVEGLPLFRQENLPQAAYYIGHNVDFDLGAARRLARRTICTLAMAQAIWPGLDSHSLTALYYALHGRTELTRDVVRGAHSALDDVAMTHDVLLRILEKASLRTLEEVHSFSNLARIPTIMRFGKHKGTAVRDVPAGWVKWYRGLPDADPYLLKAFKLAGR